MQQQVFQRFLVVLGILCKKKVSKNLQDGPQIALQNATNGHNSFIIYLRVMILCLHPFGGGGGGASFDQDKSYLIIR